jgi:hypothetical protein
MKKLTVGIAMVSLVGGSVFAADLPASTPIYAPARAGIVPVAVASGHDGETIVPDELFADQKA